MVTKRVKKWLQIKMFKPMMMANSRKRLVFKNILIGNHFLTLLALLLASPSEAAAYSL